MSQKPSPGRIVLYHFLTVSDLLIERPAVVTSAFGESVNLHVLFEPEDQEKGNLYVQSPIRDPLERHSRKAIEPCHADPLRSPTPGTWSWPPRV